MISEVGITRILTTAEDFDKVGLVILSYYLRLYVVEEILNIKERPEALTTIASELLDAIEQFKNGVLSGVEAEETNEVLKKLIEDQDKARIYCLNFTMNLYNQKLEQVSSGPWNIDLKRGLWCCIDLFESILHLWIFDTENEESIRKRIKYCKVYLSRLAKGQLGAVEKKEEEEEQEITEDDVDKAINEALNETKIEESKINDELNKITNIHEGGEEMGDDKVSDFDADNELSKSTEEDSLPETVNEQPNEDDKEVHSSSVRNELPNDKDIDALINRLKEQDDLNVDESQDALNVDESQEDEEPSFELPSAPTKIERKELTPDVEVEPDFIEEPEEEKKELSPAPPVHHQYTHDQLLSMMDKSDKIEKIQKLAKYAISALNYEDTVTAKDQLTEALNLLNTM